MCVSELLLDGSHCFHEPALGFGRAVEVGQAKPVEVDPTGPAVVLLLHAVRKQNIHTHNNSKERFYLTMHSTHFIYGYMASDIW